ncbi:MAG: carboxypeptidase M32 [Candidatus Izemoplasmatales bacterium]|nr:carboxypeptidase M32 [Candidatus Izemoplasmatales bacterium]
MDLKQKFRENVKKIKAYIYVLQLAGWDSNTEAPRNSFKRRGEILNVLSKELFSLQTSPETIKAINELYSNIDEYDDLFQREIRKAKRSIDKIVNIPEKEYLEYQRLINDSQLIWEDAKHNNDFESFKKNLEIIFDYNKKFALYYAPDKNPYDTMLDDYEEGMSTKDYDIFFDALKKDLVPFVKEILSAKKEDYSKFINNKYDVKKQEEFCDYLIDVLNFDRNSGLMKKSVHPFTWNTSPEDVRFTTKYLENYVFSSIFAAIHELGHALYEQQVSTDYDNTLLNGGTSMGIHESQSRFYENTIGRSEEFWNTHFNKFKELFPEQTKDFTAKDMYKAVNQVEASLIRIEADELTYPLHIMLRYDIEKMMVNGEITVDDLPEVWNNKIEEYLGIRPSNNSEGVLQDVHWSGGMIGYFPTYALGTAYSAQIYHAMLKDLDVFKIIRENRIEDINSWLKEKLHKYGSSKTPKELLVMITKEEFNPKYYIDYLKEKYSNLYLNK